eukprot:scaffold318021_cov15-Tisochrysis_lutea.AAC.1
MPSWGGCPRQTLQTGKNCKGWLIDRITYHPRTPIARVAAQGHQQHFTRFLRALPTSTRLPPALELGIPNEQATPLYMVYGAQSSYCLNVCLMWLRLDMPSISSFQTGLLTMAQAGHA